MVRAAKKKRIEETAGQFAEVVHEIAEHDAIADQPDEELFAIDSIGSKSARRRVALERQSKTAENCGKSRAQKRFLEKQSKQLAQVVSKDQQPSVYDMWTDSGDSQKSKPSAFKKRKVAGPGQSYNPSLGDHQDAVAEAVALELRKRESEERDKRPITIEPVTPVSSLQVNHEEEEEQGTSDENSERESDDAIGLLSTKKLSRRSQLKTRAQRNKSRRRSALSHEEVIQKREKNLLKSIDKLPEMVTKLENAEVAQVMRRELRQVQKEASVDPTAMTYEEAGLVPLSDELRGNLRSLIPKGNRLKERQREMVASGDAEAQNRRKRRKHEQPHAAKNVKWVARTKYTVA